MKSDIIHVTSEGTGIPDALAQADAVARFKNLPKKEALHLHLLAEEMMGMLQGLTGDLEADFWIDDTDSEIHLHLLAVISMNYKMRRKLLDTSSSGRNVAVKGVMSKIRDLFERAFEPYDTDDPGYYMTGWAGDPYSESVAASAGMWSFNRYRAAMPDTKKETEEWDELEKSIVANIADEIQIGIKNDTVEMIITKKY